MNNNPPFLINQKVVATRTCAKIIKGEIYNVSNVVQCKNCGGWTVDIIEHERYKDGLGCFCHHCMNIANTCIYFHTQFAPIITNYSDATAEILEKFKSPNETPDRILTPEKIEQ